MASSDGGRSVSDHASAVIEAADAAEAVLAIFEVERPDDDRPREAIAAARAWLRGEITVGEARKAAFAGHAAARDSEVATVRAAARTDSGFF